MKLLRTSVLANMSHNSLILFHKRVLISEFCKNKNVPSWIFCYTAKTDGITCIPPEQCRCNGRRNLRHNR